MNSKSTYRRYLYALCTLFSIFLNSQNHPGGVIGSEVWYIANIDGIDSGEYLNSAQTDILINKCNDHETDLFNFNPSIYTDKLCLNYYAPLENSTGRDVFFVGEPYKGNTYSYSHLGTLWNQDLAGSFQADSIIRNFFDFNNKSFFAKKSLAIIPATK